MIRAYTGTLGSGKTFDAVSDTRTWLKKNKGQIYTNMADLHCPEAIYIANLSEMLSCRSGLLVLDEAGVTVSSRFFHETSREVLTRFAQLRKHSMDLYYTTQHEDRVDKVLREITNENVHLEKHLMGYRRRVYFPGEKNPVQTAYRTYDPTVFALYDTMEIITTEGGSAGRADAAPALSTVARRTQFEHDAAKARAALQAEIPMIILDGNCPRYTKEAEEALLYLKERGRFNREQSTRPQLQRELRRRRWLKCWFLGPDDAPHECVSQSPWLEGYDPETVNARFNELEAELKEINLIEQVRMQTLKSQIRKELTSPALKSLPSRSFQLLEAGQE